MDIYCQETTGKHAVPLFIIQLSLTLMQISLKESEELIDFVSDFVSPFFIVPPVISVSAPDCVLKRIL